MPRPNSCNTSPFGRKHNITGSIIIKKTLSFLTALCLIFCLTACVRNGNNVTNNGTANNNSGTGTTPNPPVVEFPPSGIDTTHFELIDKLEIPVLKSGAREQIIEHTGYVVSYNSDTKTPNWVAYELTNEETTGEEPRKSHFYTDPLVKGAQAVDKDYTNSGWDRGHMAAAADMKWSEQAMRESFYLTNVCPQNHNLNGGDWKTIEELSRTVAQQYSRVYVVCGPIMGSMKNGTIGTNQVAVPDSFFKVLLIPTNGTYEGIGFLCANAAGHRNLTQYVCTIDEVEARVNIDFFPAMPDQIEETIESHYTLSAWGIKK